MKSMSIILVIVILTAMISGVAKKNDAILDAAVEITRKIFDSNIKELREDSQVEKVDYGYMQARYLKGLNEEENFILVFL